MIRDVAEMRATCGAVIVFLAVATIAAVDPLAQTTFRARTDVVQAEAIVVDADGRQSVGLTTADFRLSVDGQARAIESVDYIAAESVTATPGNAQAQARSSIDRRTPPARHVVFVVDEGNIDAGSGRAAINAVGRMLDRFGPLDRLALLSIPSGPSVDFTNEHEPIRTALNRAVGRASPMGDDFSLSLTDLFAFDTGATSNDRANQESVLLRECPLTMPPARRELCVDSLRAEAQSRLDSIHERTRNATGALDKLLRSLATMAGPKVVVMVSQGLLLHPDHRDEGLVTSLGSRAALADVKMFVILLDGSMIDLVNSGGRERVASTSSLRDRSIEEDGLRALTAASGGVLQRISAAPEQAIERLASALLGYYVIGFRVLPNDREGPHQIKIAAANPAFSVMARTQFAVTSGDRPATSAATVTSSRASREHAAFSSLNIDKTKLRVATRSIAEADGTVRILLSLDVNDTPAHPITALALGYKLTSGDRVVAETGRVVPVTHNEDGSAQPISYFAFRNVPLGRYKLEISASDGSKHSGFATHAVDAILHTMGPYRLGDILVAASASNEQGPFPVPAEVVVGSRIIAGVEVTAATPADLENVSVRFEIVGTQRRADVPGREIKLQPDGPLDQFVRATLEFPSLPDGAYVLRASIIARGGSLGDIETSLRIAR